MTTTDVAKRSPLPVVLLFLLSGFTGLVYEVVWLRWLGLLFGNTAHATATTLAAFFLGLAIGGRFWGDRARRSARPLALYGALELGVTAAALLPLGLADLYRAIHAFLFQSLGPGHPLFLAIRLALSIALLAPAASFMGGTLPVLARMPELARTVSTA